MRSYDELYILLLWFLLILFPKSTSRHQHPIRGEEGKTTSIILMTSFWYILIDLRWCVLICDDFLLTHRLIKLSFPWSQAFRVLGLSFTGCLANQVYPRGLFFEAKSNEINTGMIWPFKEGGTTGVPLLYLSFFFKTSNSCLFHWQHTTVFLVYKDIKRLCKWMVTLFFRSDMFRLPFSPSFVFSSLFVII